ncbi:bifunctional 4-hydroxy-2-oxoglutarate aldolase/2-dehydro-3-deoxy-phosphogluconate aldolase [Erythrobacter sp. SCSIO 43205]|uniref:bifunctional 4-hydroxy-2-oxoglutarate aldolase/2-dehydro-3-deoxy-phosphogluconate aldolase n=1 Tax=Erythrobacter sp. SCSIO 43205 TaxID=2779361 RepID=UPI001CA8B595|nr:bifunctional 4-hydroxy-2-oxoglutarate aldolase/2-dehydro-3-deoxy-phosphogluconate aldolase [Erythrobacter sp. SCSIO 43205]UAB77641.1 bifunctional 4-hydroxy-2-oxoglutarate aldolase/2-dehydro-3-deoxy-phosphogluconate aldolase [Erythrobacter sp. SCSIO 43205]
MNDTRSFDPNEIERVMKTAPVIPVLVVKDAGKAREQAEALVDGGLKVLEVTLRTPDALEAIKRMNLVPGAIVGAGTVINPRQLEEAQAAGSEFIVSPGLTPALGSAALSSGLPFLPGIANAGDIMLGLDMGLSHFKFFPAMASGGIPALKALSGPFGQAKFCPTGGITLETAPDWLALPQVLCVGGSWIVPEGASLAQINANAKQAASLAP